MWNVEVVRISVASCVSHLNVQIGGWKGNRRSVSSWSHNTHVQIKLTDRHRSASDDRDVTTRYREGESEGEEDSEEEEWWEDIFLRTMITVHKYALALHQQGVFNCSLFLETTQTPWWWIGEPRCNGTRLNTGERHESGTAHYFKFTDDGNGWHIVWNSGVMSSRKEEKEIKD